MLALCVMIAVSVFIVAMITVCVMKAMSVFIVAMINVCVITSTTNKDGSILFDSKRSKIN